MLAHVRNALVLAALVVSHVPLTSSADTTKTTSSISSTFSDRPSTCPSATVNYITHRLPQQCLKTNHTASVAPTAHAGNHTSSVAAIDSVAANATTLSSASGPSTTASLPSPVDAVSSVSSELQASSASIADPSASAQPDVESDSPLDNAKFLSFEEWRKQNLAQAGQSAETVGQPHAAPVPGEHRQRPGSENTLDSLGEDSEIELDFGFGDAARPSSGQHRDPSASSGGSAGQEGGGEHDASTVPRQRSKDAGKTSKERFNYASFDCAANVLKTNPKCKSSSSILVENKDSYMLNECSLDNKFLIVELCDLIMIDTVVLANFEFFSSIFRRFRVSISDRYPVKIEKWKEIGTYEARNTRDIQAFLVEDPPIWARYLRVEFLTHYGNEFYCPLSLLRVHGTTMFEQFRRDQAIDRGEIDPNDEEEEESEEVTVVAKEAETNTPEAPQSTQVREKQVATAPVENIDSANSTDPSTTRSTQPPSEKCLTTSSHPPVFTLAVNGSLCFAWESPSPVPKVGAEEKPVSSSKQTSSSSSATKTPESNSKPESSKSEGTAQSNSTTKETKPKDSSSTERAGRPKQPPSSSPLVATPVSPQAQAGAVAPAPPNTQESFFKSIHKRLLALEANATLSLQYIESQSALLRDAFAQVEKRQLNKTATFLNTLNSTVLAELAKLKGEYEQLWQSTVLELANQREEGRRDRELLGQRVKVLAEEMVAQKRLMALQATILLLCFGFVVFSRVGTADVGFVQSVMPQGRWRWDSPWASPRSGKVQHRPGMGMKGDVGQQHARSASDDTMDVSRFREGTPASATSMDVGSPLSSVRSAPTTPTASQSPAKGVYLTDDESGNQSFESLASY